MKSYIVCYLMMALKGWSQSFRGKHIIWVRPLKNWKLPTQLIIFPDFRAKIFKIAHPENYSYLPPWVREFAKLFFTRFLLLAYVLSIVDTNRKLPLFQLVLQLWVQRGHNKATIWKEAIKKGSVSRNFSSSSQRVVANWNNLPKYVGLKSTKTINQFKSSFDCHLKEYGYGVSKGHLL